MALTSALELSVQSWYNALTISGYTKYYSFAADFKVFPFAVCESFDQQEYTQLSSMRSSLNSYKIVFALCDKLIKDNIKASLQTSLTGSNNDLVYTAVTGGDAGNSYSIKYNLISGAGAAFSVGVLGTDYTVNFISSTTAKIVMDYFNANYSTLLTVKFADGNDGTGLISTMVKTNLSGGITNGELYTKDKLQKQWEDLFESSSSTVRAKTDMKEYTRTVRDETELLILYAVLTIPKT